MKTKTYILVLLILLIPNLFSISKEEDKGQKTDSGVFKQYEVTNSNLKNLLDSISYFISNCDNFSDRNYCILDFDKVNDTTNSIYIGLLYDIQNILDIQRLYKSNNIIYIFNKNDNNIKNFKLDSSSKDIILKRSSLNYFYEIPEWMFYETNDSIFYYFGLNNECFKK